MKREFWPPEWEQDPPVCVECGEQHWPGEDHATIDHFADLQGMTLTRIPAVVSGRGTSSSGVRGIWLRRLRRMPSEHVEQRSSYPYRWAWGPGPMRALDRKGELCRVICRGSMNSALIEFEDGFRTVTSRNGLRRADRC